jgi:hypothetical protein
MQKKLTAENAKFAEKNYVTYVFCAVEKCKTNLTTENAKSA